MRRSCKRLAWSAVAAWFPIVAAAAQGPANLLPNPSFELLDAGGAPVGWRRQVWSGDASFAVETRFGRSGATCVRVDSRTGADASWATDVEVRPRTRYRLRCWVKTELDKGTGHGAQLNVHELQFGAKTNSVVGTSDWTLVESEFDSGQLRRGMVNLLLGGWGQSTGTAWFDDVELVDLTEPLAPFDAATGAAFYRERVHPLLAERCFRCHGPEAHEPKARFFLASREGLLLGGELGPAVDFERPFESLLVRFVNGDGFQMPPDGKLTRGEIDLLTEWVRRGAPYDPDLEAALPDAVRAATRPLIDDAARAHWAYQPVERPAVPTVDDPDWAANPIDAFVRAALDGAGLAPSPPASRETLVRRAYYDLIGLPPTPEQVRAFLADESPDAFERLIDELLASPHYGERQARHWLDIVRYAESNSFERDNPKPHVWRYRDWVVDQFRQDGPFDRFVLHQLAGDEVPDRDAASLVATGFYRLGQWDDEPADPEQARFDELDDIVTTVAQGFLGTTINCARCHDHKLDPIPQTDYYRMLAYFRNVQRYGVRSNESVEANSVRVIATPEQEAEHAAELAAHEQRLAELDAKLAAIEERVKPDFEPVEHEEFVHRNRRIDLVRKRVGKLIDDETFRDYERTTERRRRLEHRPPDGRPKALVVTEVGPEPRPTHVLMRGNPHVPGAVVEPGVPEVLGVTAAAADRSADRGTTGRRLALAKWIASPDNPLTWRVFLNRIWQRHFGVGLVATSNDFGPAGARPSHPELLDWLAAEFVAGGFRLAPIHKLILLSRTWQQAYRDDPRAATVDPLNRLLWRMDLLRLDAEAIRDSMLAVSGSLNPVVGGPSVYPVMPAEVLAGQSRPGENWFTSRDEADRNRRTLYVHVKRSLILPIVAAFDGADTDFTCPERFQTTQPTQALGMLNSDFSIEQSRAFAADLERAHPGDLRAQVEAALWRTLQREPEVAEVERGVGFVARLRAEHGFDASTALARFCLVALNLNEFVYLR